MPSPGVSLIQPVLLVKKASPTVPALCCFCAFELAERRMATSPSGRAAIDKYMAKGVKSK